MHKANVESVNIYLLAGSGWYLGPQTEKLADVVINHGIFNESIYQQYFPSDTRYIVPLRHPVAWFKSAANYYGKLIPVLKKSVRKCLAVR